MKMRKNLLAVLLAAVTVGVALTGCGSSESKSDKKIKDSVSEESGDKKDDKNSSKKGSKKATIEETVLLDQDGIKITATGLGESWLGTDVNLLIENNSDTDVTVQARNASVNGLMIEPMISEDVVAGKKANSTMTFSTSDLEEAGIKTIAEMEFSFHIFDAESWDSYLDSEQIILKTSVADSYEQAYDKTGNTLYDANGITIVGKDLVHDDFLGWGLVVYIENNSDENITVQVRDSSVNGFMLEGMMSEDVMSGKKAVTKLSFFDSDLEENGIEDITEIETSFHIFDMESWDTIVDTEPILITFE